MAVARIRDILAFFSFFVIFSVATFNQVTTGDEQWNSATGILAPMYYVSVFSLSGVFFYAQIISK